MGLLSVQKLRNGETAKPIHLILSKDRVRSIKRGHPWVFKESLQDLPAAPEPGSLALLKDKSGDILAKGFYEPGCNIAFRAIALGKDRLDDNLISERLQRALALRRRLFPNPAVTNSFRLVNGEGDGLPGLVIDVYGGHVAVIKTDGPGATCFYDIDGIAAWLCQQVLTRSTGSDSSKPKDNTTCFMGVNNNGVMEGNVGKRGSSGSAPASVQRLQQCVYHKFRSGDAAGRGRLVSGQLPNLGGEQGVVLMVENGATFSVDIVQGQKTGFFLDQRDSRALVGRLVTPGSRVLNLFGYTGGFSIYAGRAGAGHVTTVDVAVPAVKAAERNWELNGLVPDRHSGRSEDVFTFLAAAISSREMWDMVVVDPPSFAPSKQTKETGGAAYSRLFALAARVTRSGGMLALASCSSHMPSEAFGALCVEAVAGTARRTASVLAMQGQPADHPFPIACEELRYLKFNMYHLDSV
ncbi:hypothetical protein CEUSTIGMA_g10705.t1 [Chlamydomonas eustigma]|uniref:PUA domain-containing protein n=1 Tax=Chlamydomonas eustigma TaxID=1157962 RepID=A0A250XK26_9CHLO|nr:hypothetical protein CEUSTIGMA_g10705.t1 [Chlamydomonas eustigma]|eukprot:GAX83279.1 hypothetical protein CEUSTIGMA_g10705.t1 [Chlamydomonas eustigma]